MKKKPRRKTQEEKNYDSFKSAIGLKRYIPGYSSLEEFNEAWVKLHLPNTIYYSFDIKKDKIIKAHGFEILGYNSDFLCDNCITNLLHSTQKAMVPYVLERCLGNLLEHYEFYRDFCKSFVSIEMKWTFKVFGTNKYVLVSSSIIPLQFDQYGIMASYFVFSRIIGEYKGEGIDIYITYNCRLTSKPAYLDKVNKDLMELKKDVIDNLDFTPTQIKIIKLAIKGLDERSIALTLNLKLRTIIDYKYIIVDRANEVVFPDRPFKDFAELIEYLGNRGF